MHLRRLAPWQPVRPEQDEPVADRKRRADVLDVVELDPAQQLVVPGLEPLLVGDGGVAAAGDVELLPLVAETLELLQRIARPALAQPLADDGVEVDEGLAAEEVVELLLARRILGGEPLEHRRLVLRVVIDVQVGVVAEPLVDEVDELLEHLLLLLAVVGPEGAVAVAREDAEEVLEPAVGRPERVALDVEEEVGRRRPRQ